ncbi:hypothetical protein HOP50_18g83080 [Chloropicon primus]|uniref:Uncharacterized protein n=1 Tax=Chloropicon primus TaxID=1764295 RepID=A0A5B8MYU9_9CHLO|nr:hypothetical protein A3770_18p82850 [Chloropicon primus]UPR04962.1 hypothetical protein HOP50_18g83080 [Chloropicon primus]|mmetsp:Transcript_633/g.1867  ORF Transcript_633/g.1867 Transcript_633/m.1867 type:complete len:94 (+) Transcript_633:377-658(+)|eukprot:QDZ25767.1 hypothetical protein A3770_18p82850 [Chloropicon primus]
MSDSERERARQEAMKLWTATPRQPPAGVKKKPAGGQEDVSGHPEGCACGLHLFPSLFEMAEKRKLARQKKEITMKLPPRQAAEEIDRYLKSIP